jgi:hypothetical protein
MARVTLDPGGVIESISGRVGNMVYRTYKSGLITVHRISPRVHKAATKKEKATRQRFEMVNRIVSELQHDYSRIDKAAAMRKRLWQKVGYVYDKYSETVKNRKELEKIIRSQLGLNTDESGTRVG